MDRWQPRCCVYCQETHRVFDKGSWIISSILASVIFLFLPLRDITALSASLLVGIPDGLISVILMWGQTSFCFVAGLHWTPLFGSWRRERQMGALEMRLSSISWQKLTWPLDILSEFTGVLGSGVRKVHALPLVLQSPWRLCIFMVTLTTKPCVCTSKELALGGNGPVALWQLGVSRSVLL